MSIRAFTYPIAMGAALFLMHFSGESQTVESGCDWHWKIRVVKRAIQKPKAKNMTTDQAKRNKLLLVVNTRRYRNSTDARAAVISKMYVI